MLKLLHIARIFYFHIFWQIFSLDFKHIILSRLDKFQGLPYMVGKLEMSNFLNNVHRRTIPPVALNMS